MSPSEAINKLDDLGILQDVESLINQYHIDQIAREFRKERRWIVNSSENAGGMVWGDTLSHAVHLYILKFIGVYQ